MIILPRLPTLYNPVAAMRLPLLLSAALLSSLGVSISGQRNSEESEPTESVTVKKFLRQRQRPPQNALDPHTARELQATSQVLLDIFFRQECFSKLGNLMYLRYDQANVEVPADSPLLGVLPSSTAYAALDPYLSQKLNSAPWSAHLQNFLHLHFVKNPPTNLANSQVVTMNNGDGVSIALDPVSNRFRVSTAVEIGHLVGSNGYAYILDSVILPSWVSKSLWDVMVPSFASFSTLVVRAGLDAEISNVQASLTVFAPDDNAINVHLAPEVYNELWNNIPKLRETLRTHIVTNGPYPSSSFSSTTLPTLQGTTVNLSVGVGTVKLVGVVNEATVTAVDGLAINGLVHTVDRFLVLNLPVTDPLSSCPPGHPSCANWLNAHNTRRQAFFEEFGVTPVLLEWDEDVAAHAQTWANELQSRQSNGCALAHQNPQPYGEGENLYAIWAGQMSPEEVLALWWDAERQNVENGVKNFSQIGHFTQAAWYGTTKVGCATYSNPDSIYGSCEVGVCRYWRAGNCNFDLNGDIIGQVLEGTTVCTP